MFIAFFNPQGNFDPHDSYWTMHPDFGGQLVYVKEVALRLAAMGHRVDIVTRQVLDPSWPEFAAPFDAYPGHDGVRIVRLPCGGDRFIRKEELWPVLGPEWVPAILDFYRAEGRFPDVVTGHYADGGLAAALFQEDTGVPFTFTAHSLGAQKMDRLEANARTLEALDARYHFARRIAAERVAMNHAAAVISSSCLERDEQYGHPAYRGAIDPADGKMVVIPPGVNLAVFDKDATNPREAAVQAHVEAMLARDIIPGRRTLPAVISSSRLDVKKNHLGLVRAFAENPALQEAANLVIITNGLDDPLRDYSHAKAAAKEVLDRIIPLIGRAGLRGKVSLFSLSGQEELAAGYRYLARRRSVFVLTTFYEPFGLAPLEAMAAGLPAVVTCRGGPAETLQEAGETFGVLVDPFDPADIARGLLSVLQEESAWQHYAQAGRRRVHERYTWGRTAQGYARLLEKVAVHPPFERQSLLPIPRYFRHPTPEDDLPLDGLRALYAGGQLQ